MANTIITKFAIGSDQDINTLLAISEATAREKYADKVPADQLEAYIKINFSDKVLHDEINDMSNQYLVVYLDNEPAGYARITSKGKRPEIFNKKTVIRIADFSILKKFTDSQIKKNLFEKCLSVCSKQQIVWMSEYSGNPDLEFFESYGFSKNTAIAGWPELALDPVYLVKEKDAG